MRPGTLYPHLCATDSALYARIIKNAQMRMNASPQSSAHVTTLVLSGTNMAMRMAGLVARFALTMYFAKYFELKDIGAFGLIAGAAGILPGALGCGMNYFLGREIVGATPLRAGVLLRDRLAFTLTMLILASTVAGVFSAVGLFVMHENLLLLIWLLTGESLAFDIHMSLISLRKPLAANFLLFARSAGWIFPAIALGAFFGQRFRTLDFVLDCWGAGLLLNFVCLFALVLRGWPLRAIARVPIDVRGLARTVRRASLIYPSDLGLAGQLYLDRYIVNHYLGLRLLGVYTLYWQMANAVHVLVTVGVVQLALPHLVENYRLGVKGEWRSAFLAEVAKVTCVSVPLCLACGAIVLLVLPHFGMKQFRVWPLVFELMLLGITVRLVSDVVSQGLCSRNLDFSYAVMNIVGLLISATISLTLISHLGLLGVAVGMIVSPAVLLAIRTVLLTKGYMRDAAVGLARLSS